MLKFHHLKHCTNKTTNSQRSESFVNTTLYKVARNVTENVTTLW